MPLSSVGHGGRDIRILAKPAPARGRDQGQCQDRPRGRPSRQTGDPIRQAYIDRFLCRVFSAAYTSEWVLKGGTGLLARCSNGRPW